MQKEKYVDILIEILSNMDKELDRTLEAAKREGLCYGKSKRNEQLFDVATKEEEESLQKISKLSKQLDDVTAKMQAEKFDLNHISEEKKLALKQINQSVSEKTMLVTTVDEMNKEKFDSYIAGKRKDIKALKDRRQTVSIYYNTMANHMSSQSYLYDKTR